MKEPNVSHMIVALLNAGNHLLECAARCSTEPALERELNAIAGALHSRANTLLEMKARAMAQPTASREGE